MSGSRVEHVTGENWRDFLAAPVAVLVLGKTTCPACQELARELEEHLRSTATWPQVRFGKLMVDERGMADFKREQTWLAAVETLPFTQIFIDGRRWRDFTGGNVARLARSLENLPSTRAEEVS